MIPIEMTPAPWFADDTHLIQGNELDRADPDIAKFRSAVDCTAAALLRNALHIQIKRMWWAELTAEGWAVCGLRELPYARMKQSGVNNIWYKDPVTALTEVDVWWKENIENKQSWST